MEALRNRPKPRPTAGTEWVPRRLHGKVWHYAIWGDLALLVIVLCIISPSFGTVANLTNVLQQASMEGIVAFGMLVMMVCGGFDLSVGAVGSSAAVMAVYVTSVNGSLILAILSALAVGLGVGRANGVIIAKGRINPFMTTFAMASVVSGIQYTLTTASPVTGNAGG